MRIRFLVKEQGSITVFLSVILIVIISFVLSTIEAARITAAQATARMYSDTALRSFLGNYYYPLFEDYGILAVDGGFGGKVIDPDGVKGEIEGDIKDMIRNSDGGLVNLSDVELESFAIYDLLDGSENNKASFIAQVRTQAKYSLGSVIIDALMGEDSFELAKVMPEVYEKQSKAMEEAAAVNTELLRLMELVDGISTTSTGFDVDSDNELYSSRSFLKNFGIKDSSYMESTYGLAAVYDICWPFICDISGLCDMTLTIISRSEEYAGKLQQTKEILMNLQKKYQSLSESCEELRKIYSATIEEEGNGAPSLPEEVTEQYEAELLKLTDEMASLEVRIRENSENLQTLTSEYDSLIYNAGSMYGLLKRQMEEFVKNAKEATTVMGKLLLKKAAFETSVSEYESFLKENDSIPLRFMNSLLEDAASVRSYTNLEKSGYDTEKMLKTLATDLILIKQVAFSAWNPADMSSAKRSLNSLSRVASNMTYDGLKFNYSGIKKNSTEYESVKAEFSNLFSEGVCTLLSVEEVSDKELNGLDLVSEESPGGSENSITETFKEMTELVEKCDVKDLISQGAQELSDDFLLEVYMTDTFSDYSMPHGNTKLDYEREYILAGEKSDAANLSEVLLKLVGLKAVFSFTSLVLDAERSGEALVFAESVLGATGNPALVYALKYSVLVAWAIHEALVEVCALVNGKNVVLFSTKGVLTFSEILMVTPASIKLQSERITSDAMGISYSLYLLVLSILQLNFKKIPRILDLIQENIRLSYRDSFRIKNCITGVSFDCGSSVRKLYDTGFFSDKAYHFLFSDESYY